MIFDALPAPGVEPDKPFQLQVTNLDYDDHLGRMFGGKILRGTVAQAVKRSPSSSATARRTSSPSDKDIYIRGAGARRGGGGVRRGDRPAGGL